MLCFIAFTPHSPLLIESIGKENIKHIAQTKAAMQNLSEKLIESKPEVILLISSHSIIHESAFSINLHDEYIAQFNDFGDLSTKKEFEPDLELISNIQRSAREESIPFVLESYAQLDYGTGVPLMLLCDKINAKLVPVSYSGHNRKQHIEFGRLLKDVISHTNKRVAVIASGDLSHCLTSDAPMGFKKEGKVFDDLIIHSIEQLSESSLLSFDEKTLELAAECAFRPILILFGIIERINIKPQILSYESPFGVGYLVAYFQQL